ncbi:MAG: NAD(P)H-hydrate dehydratase [Chloroflexi bacterium]|nr:NAD(P)H-hydrate dehydratase [Chloroflexota bacterium]
MKVVTVEQMKFMESLAGERGVTTDALMEKAGLAIADYAIQQIASPKGARVLVLVGPGNNGGDGLVAARYLHQWGARVCLYLCTPRQSPDPKLALVEDRGALVFRAENDPFYENLRRQLATEPLVIDAVLGTGKGRPLEGYIAEVLKLVGGARTAKGIKVLAVDLPTGLNADTGELDPATLHADVTVALGYPKVGHFTFPGPTATGRLVPADIGIPPNLDMSISLEMATPDLVHALLPKRPLDSHKGTFGSVLAVAGSRRYAGAAYLACMAAYRAGAGLVTLAAPQSIYPILASKLTEVTHLPVKETSSGNISIYALEELRAVLDSYDVLLVGCGLGADDDLRLVLGRLLLESPGLANKPLVLDADALNHLARIDDWHTRLKSRTVLTPHPGEMARLLHSTPVFVQSRRLQSVQEAARTWQQTVVLKGAYSLVASPNGATRLNPFANPALATAGTGDVLAGAAAGLLAQGLTPYDAATVACYIHAAAAEALSSTLGDAGLIATDLLEEIPRQVKSLKAQGH